MEDLENIQSETRPQPQISLVDFGTYTKLNESLSNIEDYDLGESTARAKRIEPQLAKVNRQFDKEGNETGYDVKCVAEISSKVQMKHPELLTGLTLINPWDVVKAEDKFEIREALHCEQHTLDWLISHTDARSRQGENYLLWLGDVAPSEKVKPAIERITKKERDALVSQKRVGKQNKKKK